MNIGLSVVQVHKRIAKLCITIIKSCFFAVSMLGGFDNL